MSDGYVVDSGVFARWFLPQVGWEHARRVRDDFLSEAVDLETPDLARIEVANVLRKAGLLRGILDADTFAAASRTIDDLDIAVQATDVLALERAVRLSAGRMVSVYDAVFVDLALQRGLPLLTADAKLARAVAGLLSTELLDGIDP